MRETHLREGRQTIKLGLIKVMRDLFPEYNLKTAYSILEGVFCNLDGSILSEREVRLINLRLHEWVEANNPIQFLGKEDGYFKYMVDDLLVKAIYPAMTTPSQSEEFEIIPFSYGFIVDFGDAAVAKDRVLIPPDKLSETFEKHQKWLNNLNVEFVSDVNQCIREERCNKILSIAEALHEKEIADIADMVLEYKRALRILLIAGPSSSGKTSFSHRLSTQLEVNGLKPVPLSLDNYYLDRHMIPRDPDGQMNFENLDSLDLKLLQDHVGQLIDEKTVETPLFDFNMGGRKKETLPMHIGSSDILVIEGIHALNPALLKNINRKVLFKVYVSALGGLNIDLMNRIPTTEIRLIRRLVRDDRFRGTGAEETIERWAKVRAGEYVNIFEFQEEADVMFNSSLLYEMNALRPFAESSLAKISPDSPHYQTKERLLNLLSFFEPMDTSKVPFNSILREFIGGSLYFNM